MSRSEILKMTGPITRHRTFKKHPYDLKLSLDSICRGCDEEVESPPTHYKLLWRLYEKARGTLSENIWKSSVKICWHKPQLTPVSSEILSNVKGRSSTNFQRIFYIVFMVSKRWRTSKTKMVFNNFLIVNVFFSWNNSNKYCKESCP